METKMEMLLPAVEKMSEKLDDVVSALSRISNAASEQKGKVEAKFGTFDMLAMVAVGAVGSFIVGTMLT